VEEVTYAMSGSSMRRRIGVGAPLLFAATVVASAEQPHDKAEGQSVFLRFLDRRESGDYLQNPPHLGLSFGGRQRSAVMDTGSTGIVVSAAAIPDIDRLPSRGPGTLTYTSSGRIMQGDWVVTRVTITGANGVGMTTSPIPVLAVRSIACLANARNCTPREDPRRVAMIGVGFARRGNREGPAGPDKNPFLNVAGNGAGHAELRRGYIVSSAGVQIGLTRADPGEGYVTVQLTWDDARQDWSPAPACITINDRTPAACGTVLPDTGVTGMFLALPFGEAQASAGSSGTDRTLASGSKVTISLAPGASVPEASAPGALASGTLAPGASAQRIASYSFRVGDVSSPLSPSRVTLVGRGDGPPFVNTGVHLLNGFDYLFDADKGIVGYRWTGRLSAR
jgi:hypothetical protein